MSILSLLFSFKGRIGRAKYWLLCILAPICLGVLLGVYVAILGVMSPSIELAAKSLTPDVVKTNYAAFWPLLVPVLFIIVTTIWIVLATYVKRLHDRDKSSVWLLAIFGPLLLTFVNPLFIVAYALMAIWFSIEMGFFLGTSGPNRYDTEPSPLVLNAAQNNWDGPSNKRGATDLGGMQAAMAAINAAAREHQTTADRSVAKTAFAKSSSPEFGRLNAGLSPGGFGRRGT